MRGEPKLTSAMQVVLQAAYDSPHCGVMYDAAERAGGNGATLAALTRRGHLVSRQFANGQFWEITEAGRRALEDHPHPSRESSNG